MPIDKTFKIEPENRNLTESFRSFSRILFRLYSPTKIAIESKIFEKSGYKVDRKFSSE